MKFFVQCLVVAGFFVPAFAFAYDDHNHTPPPPPTVTITSATLDGGTYGNDSGYLIVNPGDPITVTVTADLTNKAKWKGTAWGINNSALTPTCVNTKNKHAKEVDTGRGSAWYGGDPSDDNRGSSKYQNEHSDHDFDSDHETNNTFTITFSIFAPKQNGVYNVNLLPDGKNNCGSPDGPLFVLTQAVIVGINPLPPVIAPHDDILVALADLAATSATVTYTPPTATSNVDGTDPVACAPASGSIFPLGSTIVTCTAHDSLGHVAMPVSFTVTVIPPPDTTPPVISGTPASFSVEATSSNSTGATVTYTLPLATDDRDGSVPVSCTPLSGDTFPLGTTTVACSASDAAGNTSTSNFDVGVYLPPAAVVTDTIPPVIAAHDDVVVVLAHASFSSTTVAYTLPTATDNVDGTDPVSCTPLSGSLFNIGTTTVTCSAHDAAGNPATPTTFSVGVYPFVPQPVTLASQSDQSYLCLPDESDGWRACYTGGDATSSRVIDLGSGAGLGAGALHSVTIALAANVANAVLAQPPVAGNPFTITLSCFTDAAYTVPCTDWVHGTTHNGGSNSAIFEQANLLDPDQIHWTAGFTDVGSEANFDGSSPVVFNPADYYQLQIADAGIGWPMYGTQPATPGALGDPYWVINGLTQ